jgi:tRNA A37 threonylcarbamoyladenosine biosynthesis protein TsaE
VHVYDIGSRMVYHVDLYRLKPGDPLGVLDLPEPGAPGTIVLAEWGNPLLTSYPDAFVLRLRQCGPQCRAMELEVQGSRSTSLRFHRWQERQGGTGGPS